jgi:GNAT superfamily N-acetyltransferase
VSEADDRLREMAANRGCRLVKSRRRKPGGDFGRYGLKDARSGKEVLGFGGRGLTATAAEIEAFLRGGAAARWKKSLGAPGEAAPAPAARRKSNKKTDKPAAPKRDAAAAPAAKAKRAAPPAKPRQPAPEPALREARPRDAGALARLIVELGYEVGEADVRRRLQQLRKAGEPALVADLDGPIALLTWHVTPVLHRPRPVGRITMFVVAEAARGGGLGTRMLEAAEARLRDAGCGLVEVTSNMKRSRAHGFYERNGYDRTSFRFAKKLQD